MKKAALTILFLLLLVSSAFAAFDSFEDLVAAEERKEAGAPVQASGSAYEEAKKEIEAVKKLLRFQTDKIENVTWVNTRLTETRPCADIYCGESDGKIWLRLVLEPRGKSLPMFMEKVFLNIDGEFRDFSIKAADRKTTSSVSSSKIGVNKTEISRMYYEKVDMSVAEAGLEPLLRQMASAKTVLVRFRGNDSQDFKMSKTAQTAFDAMLRYYRARQTILAHEQGK